MRNVRMGGTEVRSAAQSVNAFKTYELDNVRPIEKPELELVTDVTTLSVGDQCYILEVGTTDFTLAGASSNTAGVGFVVNSTLSGTGSVAKVTKGFLFFSYATTNSDSCFVARNSELYVNFEDGLGVTGTTDLFEISNSTVKTVSDISRMSLLTSENVVLDSVTAVRGSTGLVDSICETQSSGTVTAGSFVIGNDYEILTAGTTDFTLIGAADNTVGTVFTATGAGSGTGTAYDLQLSLDGVSAGLTATLQGSDALVYWNNTGANGCFLVITSGAQDQSGVSFTIDGLDEDGVSQQETITGGYSYMQIRSANRWRRVDSITSSARHRNVQIGHFGYSNFSFQVDSTVQNLKAKDVLTYEGGVFLQKGSGSVRNSSNASSSNVTGYVDVSDLSGGTPAGLVPPFAMHIDNSTGSVFINPAPNQGVPNVSLS